MDFVTGQTGFALAYRKSGSGRLRYRTLRQLGFCLTLRFKSRLIANKHQEGQRLLTLSCFGQTGFEPATPSPPDLYAKPLRHCPLLRPWTNN